MKVAFKGFDSNFWTSTTDLAQLPTARHDFPLVYDTGILYVLGGNSVGTDCRKYTISTDAWASITAMSSRLGHCAAVVSGTIYCFGGIYGGTYYNTILKYNIAGNSWTTAAATLPANQYGCGCVAIGTDIYVFGGTSSAVNYRVNAFKYNTVGDSVTNLTDMTYGRSGPLVFQFGTDIYIVGGYGTSSSYSGMKYTYGTDTWNTLGQYDTSYGQLIGGPASCVKVGNYVYGVTELGNPIRYEIPSNKLVPLPRPTMDRKSVALSSDGTYMYWAGGIDWGTNTDQTEFFRYKL